MSSFDTLSRWSLSDLLAEPVEQSLEGTLAELERAVSEFEAMRSLLAPTIPAADFNAVLAQRDCIANIRGRIEGYADLFFDEDTQNPAALSLHNRVYEVLAATDNRTLFFDIWFKDLPDDTARRLIAESGDLRYFLETVRRFKPYTLSEAEEKVINIKDVNGIDAVVELYQMITNGFTFTLEIDGEKRSMPRDQLVGYFQNASPEVRRRAYQEQYRVYGEHATILAQVYMHLARDWHAEGVDLRGYSSAIEPRNLDNDLPGEVVETLLAVCRGNAGLFQRYFKLKARWLGLEHFTRYDLYTPLAASGKTYGYATAVQMVLDCYQNFSPEVAALVKRVFEAEHVDAGTRPGKLGGAFCYTAIPALTPWVSLNYEGHVRDIATLAHELGHAVHNMLADRHSPLMQAASLPLAETASVFGERLLTDWLLKKEQDPAVRRELLASALDDAYITVMRQAFFTRFEKDAHAMIAEGSTMEELDAHYYANLREQFGDAVEIPEEFKREWIGVPHFYQSPFYTYAYSFGQLLVLSLYQQYRKEGQAFLPRYLRILSYGGSEAPMKILCEAGLDVASPAFWQGGFDVLEQMLAELEQLA